MVSLEWYAVGTFKDVAAPFSQLKLTDGRIKSRAMVAEGEYNTDETY